MDWLSDPFPHAVGTLFDAEELQAVLDEFPSADAPEWRRYGNEKEFKLEGPPILWGEATRTYFEKLASMNEFLSDLTGIPNLTMETIGGGYLELWDDKGIAVTIAPEFGTTAIFETSDISWHGHPRPANRWRKSVAAYFFSPEQPPGYRADHSTVWHSDAHSSH